MEPERLLEWADKVRAAQGPAEFDYVEFLKNYRLPIYSTPPVTWKPQDCGCPLYGLCLNTACPRRIQVTYGVGWSD